MKSTLYLSKLCLSLIFALSTLVINAQQTPYTKKQVLLDGQLIEQYEPNKKEIADVPINAALLAAGDDCNAPIGVTINGTAVQKSLAGATYSGIMPPCATSSNIFDTWFVTQADVNGSLNIGFDVLNNEDRYFGITLWVGCTGDSPDLLSCWNAPIPISGLLYSPDRLNPNQTIYLQVWTYEASSQDVIVESTSYCNILFGPTTVGAQTCISGTGKYSQSVSVAYYTILEQNPTIRVVDHTFTEVYAVQATTNPQVITIPDLPANGTNQTYYIGLSTCFSPFKFDWQAPNDDCTQGTGGGSGVSCSEAVSIPIGSSESCINLQTTNFSGSTPSCSNGASIKDAWFKATADDLGSLIFEYHAADFSNLTTGYNLVDDCLNPSISLCFPPPSFSTTFFSVRVPEQYRIANKTWYVQIWSYSNEAQEICVKSKIDCGATEIELGMAECTDNQTFSQELIINSFNVSGGMIKIQDLDNNFMTVLETPYLSNPQTVMVSGLDASAENINLVVFLSDCSGPHVSIIPPDCSQGNDCPADRTISGSLDLNTYRAANTIITEGAVIISSNTDFKAGTSITLKAGFQVNSGIDFSAIIEDCSDGFTETPTEAIARIAPSSPLTTIKESNLTIYPNPFTSYATIEYHLPTAGKVDLQVVDFMGRQVAILEDKTIKAAGNYQYNFQPDDLVSGTYFVVLRSEGHYEVKKILALNKR